MKSGLRASSAVYNASRLSRRGAVRMLLVCRDRPSVKKPGRARRRAAYPFIRGIYELITRSYRGANTQAGRCEHMPNQVEQS